ncbi:hypothetical protein GCM10022409_30620 [Hymenobacter glaciei]|uniref:DUF304 domain-containing protein n=2 Tax=Hymenobacter glaciei TaxID=877209 RepID=A0ABP7UFX1_9BACT
MVGIFLIIFAALGVLFVPFVVVVFEFKKLVLPLLGTLLVAAFWLFLGLMKEVFRVDFDLDAQHIALHYTWFPSRTIITRVSFSAIEYLRLRRCSYGPANLELLYLNVNRKPVTVLLHTQFDEVLLNTQLEWLRPALGAKIFPMVEIDD